MSRFTLKFGIALIAGIALAGCAGPASHSAPAVKDVFVSTVRANTTVAASYTDAGILSIGLNVCTSFENGTSSSVIAETFLSHDGWGASDTGFFIGAAVNDFCPEYISAVTTG